MNNLIPEPDFEQWVRALILRNLMELENFEEFLRKDPNIARFLDEKGSLEQYLVEMLSAPDSWTYLLTMYLYYNFWFYESSSSGFSAILIILRKIEQLIDTGIKIDFEPVIDELKILEKKVTDGFYEIHEDIKSPLLGFEAVMVESITVLSTAVTTSINATTVAIGAVEGTTAAIGVDTTAILAALREELPAIRQLLEELPNKLAEALREHEEEFANSVAKEVNKTIVGESYFKWSSTTQFYPSMVFVFSEPDATQNPRRSQIKVRLNVRAEDFTDEMVISYRERLILHESLSYRYGNKRCNYVSGDKRFKTTIYTETKEEAVRVLQIICFIINEPFIETNLSVTEGWRRPPLDRRTLPLIDNPAEQQNYNESFLIKLVRAVIFVNGLKYPISALN